MVCDTPDGRGPRSRGFVAKLWPRSDHVRNFSGDQQGPMKNVLLPFGSEWCSKLTHLESSPALILEVSEGMSLVKGGDFQ